VNVAGTPLQVMGSEMKKERKKKEVWGWEQSRENTSMEKLSQQQRGFKIIKEA